MSTDHDEVRRLLGGYLLGGLDEADTDRLDAHLLDCDECRTELERLAPIPELLQRLPEAQRANGTAGPIALAMSAKPSPERIESLLRKMRAERSRENRVARIRWLAAAAVVLIAAAIGFGVLTSDRGTRPPQALPSPQLVTARFVSAAGSGLSGEAVLTPKVWGVSVSLDVSRLQGDGPFICQVRNTSGEVQQAAVWGPTPSGNAKVIGASSIQLRNVSAIAVADISGHVLGTAKVH
ncbi:MAG TPA: zf-HC2 domain-containing protein [Actinoplanes sp.]|jgi:anti-sigma factor RsiW|nr:zf-HC2 domain-containing protein [Actinoplanes sp.]